MTLFGRSALVAVVLTMAVAEGAESIGLRVVSEHKAVFTKPPQQVSSRMHPADATILGNGDLLAAFAPTASSPENLAPKAAVSASSEYDENYAARFAVDEQIPEANSKQDRQQAWCVNRAKAGDHAEFTLEWKEPIEVAEIVYFGRTAQILSECWKDYEVYLDQNPQPVAKGTFQMVHGPQRIEIEKQRVRKIGLKLLNSYGPYNPGASEIAVYSSKPSDEQLAQFPLPPSPPAPPWTEPLALPDFKNNPYQCQIAELALCATR